MLSRKIAYVDLTQGIVRQEEIPLEIVDHIQEEVPMIRPAWVLAGIVMIAAGSTLASAGGNASFILGQRMLDKDDWEPTEEHTVSGVTVDFAPDDWPIHLAVGAYVSADEASVDLTPFGGPASADLTMDLNELSFGVLKVWKTQGATRPFVGGGVVHLQVMLELEAMGISVDDDDSGSGV